MALTAQDRFDVLVKLAGMKDAPNYRTTSRVQRRCSTCKNWQGKKGGSVGKCHSYNFLAAAKGLCDTWKPTKKPAY